MSRVSVLVAVYNAERYLPQCLDSLGRQTLSDIQVVCVDDASTDSSLSILNQYAAGDSRFLILHQTENTGQAVARNHALQYTTGDFVAMLDADDYFSPDALQKAVEVADSHPQTDAVLFHLVEHNEDTGTDTPYTLRTDRTLLNGREALRLSLDWSIHGLYLVRAELHKRYPFDTTCRLYSDDNTTRLHYLHSREVRFCDGTYFYRKHASSCTNTVSINHFLYMEANLSMKRQLEAEHVDQDILDLYERHRWLNFVGQYWYYYCHRDVFRPQRTRIFARMQAILPTIERRRLPLALRCKLGHMPFHSFRLFRLQADFYFRLRHWLSPASEHVE
jgi:glycosyltransferase involved in cell wall biosynthesis